MKKIVLFMLVNSCIFSSIVNDKIFYSPEDKKCYKLLVDLSIQAIKCPKEYKKLPKIRMVR